MDDRTLLYLAAKAVGIKALFDPHGKLRNCSGSDSALNIFAAPMWNPLTDDGDALRLAVKLGLHISQQLSYVSVCQPHGPVSTRGAAWTEDYKCDPYAATRRAIVRAAAAIGEKMPC